MEEAGHQWHTKEAGVRWQKGQSYVSQVEEPNSDPRHLPRCGQLLQVPNRMMKLGHLTPYTLQRYRRSYEL